MSLNLYNTFESLLFNIELTIDLSAVSECIKLKYKDNLTEPLLLPSDLSAMVC